MSKSVKRILTVSAALLMTVSIGTGVGNLTADAKYHYPRTHVVHKHHRYHKLHNRKLGEQAPAYDLVQYAKEQIGKHHYTESLGIGKHSRNGMLHHPKNGWADCSSFVYFVYRHCGYKVPPFYGNAWAQEGSVVGPKRVRANQTVPGSIVQNPIHMVMLEEKYHGPKTKIIEEGGYWNGRNRWRRNVNEGYLGGAFTPDDGHYLFFNPVKANNTNS